MYVLITTQDMGYEEIKVVDSLKKVADWKEVEGLIFHDSVDSLETTILQLAEVLDVVPKAIYVNTNLVGIIRSCFEAKNLPIYDDDEFLEDEDILKSLVDEFRNTTLAVRTNDSDVNTVAKFMENVTQDDDELVRNMLANEVYLKTIRSSINNLETSLVRTNQTNVQMLETFSKTAEIINGLKEGQEKITGEITRLKKYIDEAEKQTQQNTEAAREKNLSFYFPTYIVPARIQYVMLVKIFGECKYLPSFLMAYQNYLLHTKHIRCKLLFAYPNLPLIVKRWENVARLSMETLATVKYTQKDNHTFFTAEPKRDVLNTFFDFKDSKLLTIYIVVDGLYGNNLISGPNVVQLNALSSFSDFNIFEGMKRSTSITSIVGSKEGIMIPHIKDFQEQQANSFYSDACVKEGKGQAFLKLNRFLRV